MRKKTYIVPNTEIVLLNTERLMAFGDTSNKGQVGAPRNPHAMPAGGTKVF